MINRILNPILVKVSKSLYVVGKDNIPKDSKHVVTCTYESHNEVIVLGMTLHPNQIHYMAKKELFKSKWIGKFLAPLNAFLVDRENPRPSTLKRPISLLKDNKTVGIFPAGSRTSQEGASLECDASTIATLSKSPILPVVYAGPTKIHDLLTGQVYTNISKPTDVNDLPKGLRRNEHIDYITKEIETRTAELR